MQNMSEMIFIYGAINILEETLQMTFKKGC